MYTRGEAYDMICICVILYGPRIGFFRSLSLVLLAKWDDIIRADDDSRKSNKRPLRGVRVKFMLG